jgi:DNA polymerase III subunit beta
MHVEVERAAFAEECMWVSRVLPSRPTSPVLATILMEAEGDTVKLSGTDQDTSQRSAVAAVVKEEGRAAVPGRLLADIARSLPNKPVTFRLEGTRLQVDSGKSSFRLPTHPAEAYPELPTAARTLGQVDGEAFAGAVSQVTFAAAKDETMPVLSTVYVGFKDGELRLAATDRYRLSVRSLPWAAEDAPEAPLLLRARTVAEIVRPINTGVIALVADESGSLVGLNSGNRRSTLGVFEGTFPDFDRLLPSGDAETVAEVDVAELVGAARRVRLVVDRSTVPMRLRFSDGELLLTAGNDSDAGATESVDCKVEGPVKDVAFNPEYLLEGLGALTEPVAQFRINGPARPVLLMSPGDEGFRHLLMPVRLD